MDYSLELLSVERNVPKLKALRAGDRCPKCGQADLDYNGLLNLTCPQCGFTQAGSCFS